MKHIDLEAFTVVPKGKRGPKSRGGKVLTLTPYATHVEGRLSKELKAAINGPRIAFLVNGSLIVVRATREEEDGYVLNRHGGFSATTLAGYLGIDRKKMRGTIRIHMEPIQDGAFVGDIAAVTDTEAAA